MALLQNKTWSLGPYTPSQKVVRCKWVFLVKHKLDGSIEHNKARLVAKGFHQRPGIDFHSTFNQVTKTTTISLILSLVVSLKWSFRQVDVNNAFLQDTLHDIVFMQQLLGFVDSGFSNHVLHYTNLLMDFAKHHEYGILKLRSFSYPVALFVPNLMILYLSSGLLILSLLL